MENKKLRLNDCSECNGICCLNPPEIRSLEELKFALQHKAKIFAYKEATNKYLLTVAKENGVCKFLNRENGECSIYDNRFEACKLFDCKLLSDDGISVADFKMGKLGVKKETSKPVYFDRKTIRRYKIKRASKDYIIQKAFATSVEEYASMFLPMIENLREVWDGSDVR